MAPYYRVLIDSCFISELHRVDKSCGLLEWYHEFFASVCIIDEEQYEKGPCNQTKHNCTPLNDLISDEETIEFLQENTHSILGKIYSFEENRGDFTDIKLLACAQKERNSAILSCDNNLLIACKIFNTPHYCFKASLVLLSKIEKEIFMSFNTSLMFQDGENPFFHFPNNRRCTECQEEGRCEYQSPSPNIPVP